MLILNRINKFVEIDPLNPPSYIDDKIIDLEAYQRVGIINYVDNRRVEQRL